jgi:GTPase SAR1 family protein
MPKTDKSKQKRKPVPQPAGVKSGKLPDYPCAQSLVGLSKSGKSTLLAKILTDPELMGNFFHTIVMMSPTADSDSTITGAIDMPEENIYTNFEPQDIRDIINARQQEIKKKGYNKIARTNRMCMIFDDCIAHRQFLKSKEMLDLTATVRHQLISVFFLTQSLNMIARPCRINLRGIYFFESNANEVEVLLNECRAPSLSKNDMRDLVHYATSEPYSFLMINRDAPYKHRYRKNLDIVLELS